MPERYATEFSQIPETLTANDTLRNLMLELVMSEQMPGKVLEGRTRLIDFRILLCRLVKGEISINDAYVQTEAVIPRDSSEHASNNRVFPAGWAERLVRTQFSRFYNQSVLRTLIANNVTRCFVPHSLGEDKESNCSVNLAGQEHDTQMLLDRLQRAYGDGDWTKEVKIPDHPHCTHTITPPQC